MGELAHPIRTTVARSRVMASPVNSVEVAVEGCGKV